MKTFLNKLLFLNFSLLFSNFSLVMSKGSSMKWQSLFETIVGHRRLEIEPLLEYFQPLYEQLSLTNKKTNEYIGWKTC